MARFMSQIIASIFIFLLLVLASQVIETNAAAAKIIKDWSSDYIRMKYDKSQMSYPLDRTELEGEWIQCGKVSIASIQLEYALVPHSDSKRLSNPEIFDVSGRCDRGANIRIGINTVDGFNGCNHFYFGYHRRGSEYYRTGAATLKYCSLDRRFKRSGFEISRLKTLIPSTHLDRNDIIFVLTWDQNFMFYFRRK